MRRKIILTSFAGRKECMRILLRYVKHFVTSGVIDEFHAWNFTRDPADEAWLRHEMTSGCTWQSATCRDYMYHEISECQFPLKLKFRTASDAHLLVHNDNGDVAEVVFGGWNNTQTAVRNKRQGAPFLVKQHSIVENEWNEVEVAVCGGKLTVTLPRSHDTFDIPVSRSGNKMRVSISAWNDVTCDWMWQQTRSMKFMEVQNKSRWKEYYDYYTPEKFPHTLIIKCDDDIVYIDPSGFQEFINESSNMNDFLLAFPMIINNGTCAYHLQQQDLLPPSVFGHIPYDTFEGRLWGDGILAEKVHQHFVDNRNSFVERLKNTPYVHIPVGHRISINFFAVRSEDLDKTFQCTSNDDERDLTITIPQDIQRQNVIISPFIVSHLAFYRQRETGLNTLRCIEWYDALASKTIETTKT